MSEPAGRASIRVLIVEDSPTQAFVARAVMQSLGAVEVVGIAGSAEAALELVKTAVPRSAGAPVDLMLLDIHLPDMDGLQLLRLLRAQPQCAGLKIIMLTGSDSAAYADQCIQAGADGFVAKPLTATGMQQMLECIGLRSDS